MTYKYFPIEFFSYEDYVKYLKEKGLALEAPEGMYKEEQQWQRGTWTTLKKNLMNLSEFINLMEILVGELYII